MAKQAATAMRIWLDEFALASDLSSIAQNVDQETPVVTAIADDGPRRVVANYDFGQQFLGFLEPLSGGYDEALHALLGSAGPHYTTIAIGAGAAPTIGDVAYDGITTLTAKPITGAVAGAVLLNFDLAGGGGLARGVVLGSKTTTGAENLTGVNHGTTSAGDEFRAIFRVVSFSGTNITLTVEESSDDGGGDAYATITGVTSGALTGAGVVAASTTAATEAYKRLAITGTFTSAVIAVSAGVVA